MRRRKLLRIGVTFVLFIAAVLFYFINVQVSNYESTNYRRILIRGTQDLQVLYINKNDVNELAEAVYEQDHLAFESEVEIGGDENDGKDDVHLERFGSRQLSVNTDSEQEQEFYYDNSIPDSEQLQKRARFTEALLTPVVSRDVAMPRENTVHLCVVVCEDRAPEALTMLKSAARVTANASIVFHIIADEPRQKIMQEQLEMWPKEYSFHVSYYIYNVTYFEGTAWKTWKTLYKPCAVQRLFLPDRLLSVDSLIYVDTDTVFLRSAVDLWRHFEFFNSSQLISLVQESEDGTAGWYNRFASHPYYGQFGVNSGVMLMNLTRLRRTNWLSDMQSIYQKYELKITWGDQDLINIYFSQHPEQLFIMPCDWNYRTDHCMYVSNCKVAEEKGVSLLHGSRGSFYKAKEPAFQAVHEAFQQYALGDGLKLKLLPDLRERLKNTSSTNCGKIQSVFLSHLSALAESEYAAETKALFKKNGKEYFPSNSVINNRLNGASALGSPVSDKLKVKDLSGILGQLRIKQGYNMHNIVQQSKFLSKAQMKHSTDHKPVHTEIKNSIDYDAEDDKKIRTYLFNEENVSS